MPHRLPLVNIRGNCEDAPDGRAHADLRALAAPPPRCPTSLPRRGARRATGTRGTPVVTSPVGATAAPFPARAPPPPRRRGTPPRRKETLHGRPQTRRAVDRLRDHRALLRLRPRCGLVRQARRLHLHRVLPLRPLAARL